MSGIYEVDGREVQSGALHPVGLFAATAEGLLAVVSKYVQENAGRDGSELSAEALKNVMPAEDYDMVIRWLEKLWNTPLRTGNRRYYDNCLYYFAYLALSGNYRIW